MKIKIRLKDSILTICRLIPCLLLAVFIGCGNDMLDGNRRPSKPSEPSDSEFPSLLTLEEMQRKLELDKSYKPEIRLLSGGTYLSTLEYVVLLFKDGTEESLQRGELILQTIIDAQITDTATEHYGNWPWGINDKVGDRNPPLFFSRRMLGQLWEMQDRMSSNLKLAFLSSCQRLVDNAKRRWDVEVFAANRRQVAYTNAYCLYLETLTLAGVRFEDSELVSLAKSEWDAFYTYFKQYGVAEFLSRDYDNITFNALWGMRQFVTDELQKKEIIEVMDHVYILKSAVCHPVLNVPITGISRDDRRYNQGNDARSEFIMPGKAPAGYTIPAEATRLMSRTYPFEFNGRAGDYTFTFKSYQEEKAGLGSMTGWGSYYSQQVHCLASLGSATNKRSTLWLPGSYIHVNGFTDQKGMSALCVYNRLPTLWHRDQWRGNQNDISSTLFDFGVGLSTQWIKVQNTEGKIVLEHDKDKDYQLYLFPYVLNADEQIRPCSLKSIQRTKSSEKYHTADLKFEELVFPSDALWFGVYITIVRNGESVSDPGISFRKEGDIMVFSTAEGHELKIEQRDGVSVQVREDPCLGPLYSHNQ